MKILNKLTIRNLKLNRTRTLVAMFGIVLKVGLINSVVGLGSSHATFGSSNKTGYGDYHAKFIN